MSHVNNFDFLRHLFALFVIITHSYALTGATEEDFLWTLTGKTVSLSSIGITGFFALSGYLITISLMRSKTIVSYLQKRFLRIYPALLLNILFIVLVVGPIVSALSFYDYFTAVSTKSYLLHNLVLHTQYEFADLFLNNPYPKAVNGSLWTIPYEAFFYVLILSLWWFKTHKYMFRIALAIMLTFAFYVRAFNPSLQNFNIDKIDLVGSLLLNLSVYFLSGSFLASLGDFYIKNRKYFLYVALLLLFILSFVGQFSLAQFILLPVIVISFGTMATPVIVNTGKWGDFSYGIYLYGFVVQQILMHYWSLSAWELMLLASIVSTLLAAVSWHVVEKRALRLKKYKLDQILSGLKN